MKSSHCTSKKFLRPLHSERYIKTGQSSQSKTTAIKQPWQEIHSLKARLAQQEILISSLQAEISSLQACTAERTRKFTNIVETIGQAFKEYEELVQLQTPQQKTVAPSRNESYHSATSWGSMDTILLSISEESGEESLIDDESSSVYSAYFV